MECLREDDKISEKPVEEGKTEVPVWVLHECRLPLLDDPDISPVFQSYVSVLTPSRVLTLSPIWEDGDVREQITGVVLHRVTLPTLP